jgi:DNA-directed RNA polymerase subunit beta
MPTFRALRYRLHAFVPDLVDIQRQRFIEFLTEGVVRGLHAINPIKSPRQNVHVVFYPDLLQLTRPALTVRDALLKSRTYETLLYVPAHVFIGNQPIEDPRWILLANIPLMTNRGHFVINGSSRVLVNQMVRRPGLYFKETIHGTGVQEKRVIFVDFICRRGAWVRIQCDKQERFWVCLKNSPKIQLDDFIQALRVVEQRGRTGILTPLTPDAIEILQRIEARFELPILAPGEAGYQFLSNRFKNPKVYNLGLFARHQINRKLGLTEQSLQLTANDLQHAKNYLLEIANNSKVVDDIDNLANRRVRPAGDLLEMQFSLGLARLEKNVKQRLDRIKYVLPAHTLLDSKPVNQTFREFFGSSNPLAQFLEQLNPLSDVTHKRRINATGPGGVSRENANLEMRNIHATHYGRICPIETPEGKNAGLVNTLTVFGRVTSQGYIETPYYRVINGQVQARQGPLYFTTPQEQTNALCIAPPDLKRDTSNMLPDAALPARLATELQEDFLRLERTQVEYIGIAPSQLLSIATSLIPFLEHDDANRALMGSNMQRQTVPLMRPERPIVSTGLEGLVVGESGHVVQASRAGIVSYVSGTDIHVQNEFITQAKAAVDLQPISTTLPGFIASTKVTHPEHAQPILDVSKAKIVWPGNSEQPEVSAPTRYHLQTYDRSNQETALVQRPSVIEGEWVQQGDLLADCAASIKGSLALGHNLLVAYVPWEGYNFEDAVVISERLLFDELYTTIHIEKYETEAREAPGAGYEVITKNLLPKLTRRDGEALDTQGIVRIGRWVTTGDILVGKMIPLKVQPLSPYQRMAFDILGVDIPKTKDVSLRVPNGVRGRIVNTQVIRSETVQPQLLNELYRIRQKYARTDTTQMPELPSVVPFKVRVFIAEKRRIQVGDKVAGRHGNKGIISCILPRQDMPYLPDGTAVDMVLNPLGVPSRMNVGQIFECLLGLAGSYLGQEFRITPFDELFGAEASRSLVYLKLYQARLKTQQKWLFQPNFPGKTRVFDGRNGECFDQFVTVGKAYMLKLVHLVEEKIHARATGKYAMITQQPVGGRAKNGGQRLGEMEVWALEAYGAAYTLQELLTRKSDDLEGRATLLDSILAPTLQSTVPIPGISETFTTRLTGSEQPIHKKFGLGTSEAFRVLLLELQSLCLDVGVYALSSPLDAPALVTRHPIDLCDPRQRSVVPLEEASAAEPN